MGALSDKDRDTPRSLARVLIAFSSSESDQTAADSLAEGFTRDGITIERASTVAGVLEIADKEMPELLVVSVRLDRDKEEGLYVLHALKDKLGELRPPIIVVGDADKRAAAEAAGATAFIAKPAFVKDLVTLARIFVMPRQGAGPGWGGELGALHLYYMVRALAASHRTGVLSLLRGGRRGELRFYEGEVTSAQVGTLHGQSAFHQLLLWPEASFDLRAESVVRRQQIPLTPAELLQDAERFLRDFNEMASGISPASRYEPEDGAADIAGIPAEAMPVLHLFDGSRSVADVIEDSPMRMPETVMVVRNLIALKAIRKLRLTRPQPNAATAIAGDDWLVGQSAPAVVAVTTPEVSGAVAAAAWGDLAAASTGRPGSYAPVVPAQEATGVIESPATAPAEDPITEKRPRSSSGEIRAVDAPAVAEQHLAAVEIADGVPSTVMPTPPAPKPAPKGRPSRPQQRFEAHEEAFFKTDGGAKPAPLESFADLDDGAPVPALGFWQRVRRKLGL